ncbi:DinB family protein [Flavobacterium sp. 3HN19-14]|uniref:DinB family protein n=1 Tax=Flavobacterium sp. 3HN19-14 TaxID=3448133 RepID=UPI003EE2CD49
MDYPIASLAVPVFEELTQLIDSFSEENFNKIPFEGSWTAGQVAQHIKLSAGNVTSVLNGNTAATDRDPEEKIAQLRDLFMNFDTKMQSPVFIIPEFKKYKTEKFVTFFKNLEEDLSEAIENLDLSQTCLDFEIPGFGKLTRIELIAFVIFHTQRHIHQMRKISQKV